MSDTNKNLYTLDSSKDNNAKRKMAAIFAADVVGYSKLMAANEKLTLFRLKETRKITDPIITNLHGRIFSTAGDSIMAEFASPVDAVEAAILIQEKVKEKLKEINDNIKIEFRVGINLGDIMTQDNNLYGDNVNIAARLESIAQTGEINISEKVYLEVHNKVDVKFSSIGEKKLKNISQKIKVYASSLNSPKKKTSDSFQLKKSYLFALIGLLCLIPFSYFIYQKFISEDIEYNSNSKSVLEEFRTQIDEPNNQEVNGTGKTIISLMKMQNQSSNLPNSDIDDIMNSISKEMTNDKVGVIFSSEGAENLNPPEVMLIATESNASFIINGVIFDENNKNFLTIKIYEAKRGSLIINQKITLDKSNSYSELVKFIKDFKKDLFK